jgi:S1-C subfamily serine protease
VAIAGQAVREPRDAVLAVLDRKPGQRVVVQVQRGQRKLQLKLVLGRY